MTLSGWADLYAWQLDRASRTPLTRQIYMQVRSAVLSGALRPGTRMPSSRAMASKLGVARASVVLAYEHLLAEGYVESRHGSGTFIAGDLTGLASRRRSAPRAAKPAVPTSAQTFSDFERSAMQSDARPFNTGRTLVDARSVETWRSLTRRAVRRLGANDLGYTDPAWFHCRLVVDHNGRRLAKRHDSLSLRAMRQRGLTPMNILSAELPVEA